MKKTFIFIFTLFMLVFNSFCYAQKPVKISKPRLELIGNNINIFYDILNSKQADKFKIWVEITDSIGNKINAQFLHGWWNKIVNIGYWLPSDARQNSKVAWFGNSRLVDYLRAVQSKHTLLIADACFGGAIFKTRKVFPDAEKAINKFYKLPSQKAVISVTLTEVPDRSAFIKFLVERLEKNTEKYLSSEQLFSSFRMVVTNNCDALPQYGEIRNVGDDGGDFIFLKKQIRTNLIVKQV